MARKARSIVIVAVCAGALVACNLIAGLTEDYAYNAANGDGGPGSTDGNTDGMGLTEGSTTDSPSGDAGTDAKNDAITGRFCDGVDKTGLDFCADFEDDPVGVAPAWTPGLNDTTGVDASVKVMASAGHDSARGLDIQCDTSNTGISRNSFFARTLPPTDAPATFLSYDIEFDFRLVSSAITDEAVGVLNFTGASPEDHGVAAYPSMSLISKLSPKGAAPGVADSFGWHHARISLTHAAAGTPFNKSVVVDEDAGAVVDTGSVSTTNTSATQVRIGIFSSGFGAGVVHATFDNVVAWRRK
jgi:hypothetical protein